MLTLYNSSDTLSYIRRVSLTPRRLLDGIHKVWNDMHSNLVISLYQSGEELEERFESSARYEGGICNDVKLGEKSTLDFGESGGGRQF